MDDRSRPVRLRWVFGGAVLALVALAAGLYVPLIADSGTWLGAVDSMWNTDGNWSAPYPNGADQVATFDGTGSLVPTVILTADVTVGTLVFDSPVGYTVASPGGSGLTFDVTAGNAWIDVSSTGGAHHVSVPITLAEDLVVTQYSTGALTLSGNVIQSGGNRTVDKYGPGTLLLNGDNSYGGTTTVHAGTLALGSDTAAGTGQLSLDDNATVWAEGDRVLGNALRIGQNTVYTGTGSLAFTSTSTEIPGNRLIYVNTTTSFAKVRDATGCCRSLRKQGDGTMNLNVAGSDNVSDYLRNDQGAGQLNVYGSGTLARLYYNPGTGGGTVGVGDSLNVANGAVSRGTGILTLRGDLGLDSNTPAASNTTLSFDLNGDVPETGYDQLSIVQGNTGASRANLNEALLDVSVGYAPAVDTVFTIVTRTGGTSPDDVIVGVFRDLPDGSVFAGDGVPFLINYTEDTVTLTRVETDPGDPGVLVVTASAGTPQTTTVGTAFALPLTVTVTSDGVPQPNVLIAYTGPSTGPGAILSGGNTALTDISGQASITATANGIRGSYVVTATTTPLAVSPAVFDLTNECFIYLPMIFQRRSH